MQALTCGDSNKYIDAQQFCNCKGECPNNYDERDCGEFMWFEKKSMLFFHAW